MDEEIVLLDEDLNIIGTAPKLASHHANTPLHLAFSCYLFNGTGELLITQRAGIKKVWPGVWTNSFCGHPLPDESYESAILRRGEFELGMKDILNIKKILPNYRYKTPPYDGIIENEFCPVFTATTSEEPQINPGEVADYRWIKVEELQKIVTETPDIYSYWMKDQLKLLIETTYFQSIAN